MFIQALGELIQYIEWDSFGGGRDIMCQDGESIRGG